MVKIIIYCIFLFSISAGAQVKEVYSIFNSEGKKVSYEKTVQSLTKADVVFFGELHNNTLAHWIELQILKDLHNSDKLIIGMEMLESDDQIVIDEYLSGLIEEKHLLKEAKMWDNYKSDYRPLLEFAKQNNIAVVATNVPRRYANLVYRKGLQFLDSLSMASRKWIAPLPLAVDYSLPGYKSMMETMGQHGSGSAENLVASQALKDATMAHFIAAHQKEESLFYHINGAYHTQDYQGIITYLKKLKPDLKIITLHVAEQALINNLDKANMNKADFIFCIVEDMIKSD